MAKLRITKANIKTEVESRKLGTLDDDLTKLTTPDGKEVNLKWVGKSADSLDARCGGHAYLKEHIPELVSETPPRKQTSSSPKAYTLRQLKNPATWADIDVGIVTDIQKAIDESGEERRKRMVESLTDRIAKAETAVEEARRRKKELENELAALETADAEE